MSGGVAAHPRGVVLVLLVLVTGILRPSFLAYSNLLGVLAANAPLGIVTCGVTWVMISGMFDLSVGSLMSLVSITVAVMLQAHWALAPLIVASLAIGAGAGAINGFFVGVVGANSVIVTLGGWLAYAGLAELVSGGEYVFPTNASPSFLTIGQGHVLGIPAPGVIFIVLLIVMQVILRYTVSGRYIYAMGSRESAARLAGVHVRRYRFWLYVVSGTLAALAAIVITAWSDSGTFIMGVNYEFYAITAAVLGGVALSGAVGSTLGGAGLGVAILAFLNNAQVLLGISTNIQLITEGAVLAFVVAADSRRRRR